jgi:hypothetical protein
MTELKRCGRLFPIALGGRFKANQGNQLDYHAGTAQFAVAGDTLDNFFVGSSGWFFNYKGFIAVLKEPGMDIVWFKTVSLDCYMQGVTFSADGQLVLGHTNGYTGSSVCYMFIFNAIDGTLKKSF